MYTGALSYYNVYPVPKNDAVLIAGITIGVTFLVVMIVVVMVIMIMYKRRRRYGGMYVD